MARRTAALALIVALAGINATAASAQDERKHLSLLGIQSGTVAPAGIGFAALSVTDKRNPTATDGDGSAVLGFGFGDMANGVGVQVAAHVLSLTDEFGDSGYISLKFARQLQEGRNPVYASLRFGHLANWGDAKGRDESAAFALTRYSTLTAGSSGRQYPVMMSLGAGTHIRDFEREPGVFAGVGIGLTPSMAASAAWNGDGLVLGTGFKIKGLDGVSFGLAVEDVTNRVDNRRLVFSIGYQFNAFGG